MNHIRLQKAGRLAEMVRKKRKERALKLSEDAREKVLERQLLESVGVENNVHIIIQCMADLNLYRGKHNDSMDISFSLDDI